MDYDDDFADRAQVAGEVGENLTLANALGVQLRLVEKALVRMDEGTYGTCEVCTEPIEAERLNILPMTNHCIAHA
jgi:DnaK suppressor protein